MAVTAPPEPLGRSEGRADWLAFVAAMVIAALSIWTVLDRGWVPFDEGTIAQAAERVLTGELAHRDFTDPYTGGLPYWHALAMRVFGVSLLAPRYALFIACLLWLPALWWLARRACGARWAGVVTVIGAWWSLPIYPAAMPTWYLLFGATWILVALERWRATERIRWLVLAGLCCGVAVIIKQTGLYLVAGTLLGLLFCDQDRVARNRQTGAANADVRSGGKTDPIIILMLFALAAMVLRLIAVDIASGEVLHLIVPIGGVLAVAAVREIRLTDSSWTRWRALLQVTAILVGAAAVPVALFLLPYLTSQSMGALVSGAIGAGVERIAGLHLPFRSAGKLLVAVLPVYAVLLLEAVAPKQRSPGVQRVLRVAALIAGVALLWLSIRSVDGYRRLWFFGTSVLPLAVVALAWAGVREWRAGRRLDPIWLALAAMTAFQALNQFPYPAPNYYAYVAPLAILAGAVAAAHFSVLPRLYTAALVLAVFAGVVLRLGSVHNVGGYPAWWDYTHRLAGPRAGLLVTAGDSAKYGRILELVAQHRGTGAIVAGPELPEVYFLAGAKSPGRDSYSLFREAVRDSTQLPNQFDTTATSVVVVKLRPMFGPPLALDLYRWLDLRYPVGERIDTIEVRWRGAVGR